MFEVDPPGPQAWKRRRLIELGFGIPEWLRLVPVDFEAGDAWWQRLAAAGFKPGRPAIVASSEVSMYLTKDAIMATLRQIAALAPGSMLAMTFLLPLELADPEVRPGASSSRRRAREQAGRLPSASSRRRRCWPWPAKPASEKSGTYPPPLLPNATSRAGQMAFARQIIQRNCWWR